MPRDPRHDILFEPVAIGPKVLRNRFYQVPHCTGFGTDKPGTQARHRAVKAEGGWAAVCTEYAPVTADSDEWPYASATIWDDEDAHNLSLMVEEVHAHGALAGIQLHHSGVHGGRRASRLPALGPSQIASETVPDTPPDVPKEMDKGDIRRVHEAWAAAAVRARDVGFDIVYVYGGHSYLPGQFLSPYYNKRTDEYGGSLENRSRFWLETLERVERAVGHDCAVAVRIAANPMGAAGVGIDETLEFVRMADDLVDLWDVNIGSINEWQRDSAASRFAGEGHQLEWTSRVREATAKPIVGVSRMTNPDQMADIVRSRAWDLIGAARPSISDPFLPKKIQEGRLDEIRECMGINLCISRAERGNHLGCAQNATAGEEYRRGWHPERFTPAANADRDVLVVGAGPAGMECAIVLAKRGMRRVHLVDSAPEIGGHLRWVPRLPGLGEWARFVNHRRIQLDKLRNVEVITGVRLDAAAAAEYGAEIVVVATGSHWSGEGMSGVTHEPLAGADPSLPHVLTPEQVVIEGKRPPGRRVEVYDTDGYYMAAGIAELLCLEDHDVRIITPFDVVAPFTDETLEGSMLRRHLHECNVRVARNVTLGEVGPGHVAGVTEFDEEFEVPADGVVLVTQRVSDDALYRGLVADPE
ncbi:MAG: oxidoreductase, partial [Acidimicrobiales bacterium]